ncbi:hypothetical protein [Pseudodesulfovibrio tunisiensis]|uniref:hypothetical protein n=1 Tax=Pseudodesulfovibrio tunisiensis TaxID=463192 RepID=UPI001FB38F5E|nr:hypothetical protein [Pseudodesulfovibrio tunisiensis]
MWRSWREALPYRPSGVGGAEARRFLPASGSVRARTLLAETLPLATPRSKDGRRVCSIHDYKPEICRQYPGSRKHAAMTGCPTALRLREGEVCNVEA